MNRYTCRYCSMKSECVVMWKQSGHSPVNWIKVYVEQNKSDKKCEEFGSMFPYLWVCMPLGKHITNQQSLKVIQRVMLALKATVTILPIITEISYKKETLVLLNRTWPQSQETLVLLNRTWPRSQETLVLLNRTWPRSQKPWSSWIEPDLGLKKNPGPPE